jgi:hypothetical protein
VACLLLLVAVLVVAMVLVLLLMVAVLVLHLVAVSRKCAFGARQVETLVFVRGFRLCRFLLLR